VEALSATLTCHDSSSKISRRKLQVSRSSSMTRICFTVLPIFLLFNRQPDLEFSAGSRAAFDFDVAAMFTDDLLHHGQAESAATPPLFGREEWIENARFDFFANAFARVAASDFDISGFACLTILYGSRKAQLPAMRHSVEAVVDQIDEDLLQLFAI